MNIVLKNFVHLEKLEHEKILELRNDESIRNNMKSNEIIEIKSHFSWIENLKREKLNIYYAVIQDNNIIGAIYITNINYTNKSATWGLYFKKKINPFISSIVTYLIMNKIFYDLGINVLNLEVNKLNTSAYKFDLNFGFKVYDEYKEKDNEYYLMTMNKEYWNKNRESGILIIIKRKIDKINYKFIEG